MQNACQHGQPERLVKEPGTSPGTGGGPFEALRAVPKRSTGGTPCSCSSQVTAAFAMQLLLECVQLLHACSRPGTSRIVLSQLSWLLVAMQLVIELIGS